MNELSPFDSHGSIVLNVISEPKLRNFSFENRVANARGCFVVPFSQWPHDFMKKIRKLETQGFTGCAVRYPNGVFQLFTYDPRFIRKNVSIS